MEKIYTQLITGITRHFKKTGLSQVVVGVSGGVDSSLVLKLAVDALGPEKVTGLSMPEAGVSAQENTQHAKLLCEALGVDYHQITINSILTGFTLLPWKQNQIATINTKARIRAIILYNFANSHNALVLGTSNKSEIMLGYGTKYGDLACDLQVIGDLYKQEVVTLADHVGLPPEIVNKTPSAELYPGQTDQNELGGRYSEIDPILKRLETGTMDSLIERGLSATLVHTVTTRVEKNSHKSALPPIIKLKPQL